MLKYHLKCNFELSNLFIVNIIIYNYNPLDSGYNRIEISPDQEKVLLNCEIPGRCHVLRDNGNNVCYYLDGAHTLESMEVAKKWFHEISSKYS